jgi:CBS domain-containing protein
MTTTSPLAEPAPPSRPPVADDARPPDSLEEAAQAMRSHGIEALVVETAADARAAVLSMVPEGAEVHSGKSKTIEDLGLFELFMASDRWDFIRKRLFKMDRATQGREMRKLGAAPDIELGSVAAVTEDGALVAASATGNQLAAYVGGAGKVILVVGSQKIVKDLDAALRRIREVSIPYEDARLLTQMGAHTSLAKMLVIYGEMIANRTTVILVREPVGV